MSLANRRQLVKRDDGSPSVKRQCELVALNRSSYHYEPPGEPPETLALMREIDEIYTDHPCYGSRRLAAVLCRRGCGVGRGRVVRLMRLMGIEGRQPGPRTTRPAPGHKVHPNLLKSMTADGPCQVWASDTTYLPMPKGTMCLAVAMDWHSPRIFSWELSKSLGGEFCVRTLETALERSGEAAGVPHRKHELIYSRAAGETARRRRERSGNNTKRRSLCNQPQPPQVGAGRIGCTVARSPNHPGKARAWRLLPLARACLRQAGGRGICCSASVSMGSSRTSSTTSPF